ncbi:MAG: CoA transferase [Dehalococcoidales bacterium]|nr:CoA transferase [Dehalococcoidales bacterium]
MVRSKRGALEGLRVLDLTWVYAGPFATRQFADMGAEVIKVEPPGVGALERRYSLIMERHGVKQSSYAVFLNRGKKSLSINMKTKTGLKIIRELVKKSDIVISNMAPGAMKELGLGYEAVKRINPRIIYCTISCFGHYGAYASEPGFDLIAQVASSWCGQTDPPAAAPVAIGDANAAIHATTAILAALYYREKTGRGQNIDISMTDCLFHLNENNAPGYLFSGRTVPAVPNTRWAAAYAPYALIKGPDGLIGIAALSDILWEKLVRAMGEGYEWLLTDPRTNDLGTRLTYQNAPFIHQTLEDWVAKFDSIQQVEDLLRAAGVPAMRVKTFAEVVDAPYIRDREMVVKMKQPFAGEIEIYGSPFKMSETPGKVMGHAPLIGEHSREILSQTLGYNDAEIDKLFAEGVIYKEPAVDRLDEELERLKET